MNTLTRLATRSTAALALALSASLAWAPLATAHHGGPHHQTVLLAAGGNPLAPAGHDDHADHADHSDHADHGEAKAHGDDHGGDHGEAHRGLMDLVASEQIWTLVIFGIFFAVLSTVVWPKILGALQAREDKQRSDLKTAEEAAQKATASIAEYESKIAEARKEAAAIVAEARGTAQQAANADKAKIEAEVATLKAAAKADIAAAKEQALTDIYAQTASLSTAVAGKILQREINADDQQQLINDSLAQFKSTNS